jgi:hypothetical protein
MTSNASLSTLAAELRLDIIEALIANSSTQTLISFIIANPAAASLLRHHGKHLLENQIRSLVVQVTDLSIPRFTDSDGPNHHGGVSWRRWRNKTLQLKAWVELGLRWAIASGCGLDWLENQLKGDHASFRRYGSIGYLRHRVQSRRRMIGCQENYVLWSADSDEDWISRFLTVRKLRSGKIRLVKVE